MSKGIPCRCGWTLHRPKTRIFVKDPRAYVPKAQQEKPVKKYPQNLLNPSSSHHYSILITVAKYPPYLSFYPFTWRPAHTNQSGGHYFLFLPLGNPSDPNTMTKINSAPWPLGNQNVPCRETFSPHSYVSRDLLLPSAETRLRSDYPFSEEANLLFTSPLEPFRPTHTTHTIQTHLLSLSLVRQPHHPGPDLSQTQKKKKKKNDPPHPLALHQIPPRRPPPPHRHRNPARPRQLPNLPLRRRHMRLLPDGPGGDCADGG